MINLVSMSFIQKEKIIMPASVPNINMKRLSKKILKMMVSPFAVTEDNTGKFFLDFNIMSCNVFHD
ncbi:hypothetical protein F3J23_03785 [Chryseobacterium sp. Tr-659]|uniref:hypothetical protein n=1 Tax=Chryseobacterium sp. Tr-659 TaxID=2608340 RepID=UPI00141E6425|nr:hypothetical protein [Chryseobacterium sp. Tr-659]NIF04553.1 hypothetical protein [Chryseobacterium sp. Tr-659]